MMAGQGVDLRNRFRGALVRGAIGEKSSSTVRWFESSVVQGNRGGRTRGAGFADIPDHPGDPSDKVWVAFGELVNM